MSMPIFPDEGTDITRDQAFNMLLGSIAMEELALSHIMNAEGEKLQYVLGTLPRSANPCATTREILEVNQSITTLLEHVAHNQYLLKGKLAQVFDAQKKCDPPIPGPCPCPIPCRSLCGKTETFRENHEGMWCVGQRFSWRETTQPVAQCPARAYPTAVISPAGRGSAFVSFVFELLAIDSGQVTVALSNVKNGRSTLLFKTSVDALNGRDAVYLSGSTLLTPQAGSANAPSLMFSLCEPGKIWVKKAQLTITTLG